MLYITEKFSHIHKLQQLLTVAILSAHAGVNGKLWKNKCLCFVIFFVGSLSITR